MTFAVLDILALILTVTGLFFLTVAASGFVRFPDLFCRLHVTGIIDTLGVPLVLLGIACYVGPSLTAGKIILAIVFLYSTSPLVGHLLSRTALKAGQREGFKPYEKTGTVEAESREMLKKYRYLK